MPFTDDIIEHVLGNDIDSENDCSESEVELLYDNICVDDSDDEDKEMNIDQENCMSLASLLGLFYLNI